MIIAIIISLVLGFAGGFYAGLKNANSSKVQNVKDVIDDLKQ
jgi:uncharacterized protein YneF (UPF0154 family)